MKLLYTDNEVTEIEQETIEQEPTPKKTDNKNDGLFTIVLIVLIAFVVILYTKKD